MYSIEYNGKTNQEYGVAVTNRPNIPTPKPTGDFVNVAGRDGSLYVWDGTYDDITISVSMNYVRAEKYWQNTYRTVKNWIKGSGTLKMSDDPNWFYKVKQAVINSSNRRKKIGNDIVAEFTCDPFQYLDGGQYPLTLSEALINPFHVAHPVYYISGTGDFILSVNNNEVSGNVNGIVTIDTELLLAYNQDSENVNNELTGDYEGLYLIEGTNDITITDGLNLTVQPNWRSI